MQDATDPKAELYIGEWIEAHRNVTFHYSTFSRICSVVAVHLNSTHRCLAATDLGC